MPYKQLEEGSSRYYYHYKTIHLGDSQQVELWGTRGYWMLKSDIRHKSLMPPVYFYFYSESGLWHCSINGHGFLQPCPTLRTSVRLASRVRPSILSVVT